jgi:hypothetical protein
MKYLNQADDYLKYSSLFESYGITQENIWDRLNSLVLPDPSALSPQLIAATHRHEDFLLSQFGSITEAYQADAVLRRNGYDPIFLTLENAYTETFNAIDRITEGLWDSVKSFLSTMTNGGSPLGILQFVLDIIGIIPASFVGFPIDMVANLLNALIYFWNGEYIMGMISGIMCVPGVGQAIGGVLKGLLYPFRLVFRGLGTAIVSSSGVKAAAEVIKKTPGAEKAAATLAPLLKKFGGFMAQTGTGIISKITGWLDWAINKASFGKISLPGSVLGFTEELAKKAKLLAQSSDEAAEALLKKETQVAASAADAGSNAAKAVAADSEKAAIAAGKSATDAADIAAKDAARVAKKFDNIPGFSKELQNEVMKTAGYKKLLADGVSDKIKDEFVRTGVSNKLMRSILNSSKGSKSLVNVLNDPKIVAALAKNNALKITDKVLVDAFTSGNVKQIREVLDLVVSNPQLMKAVSPRTAKAISVFRAVPEVFSNGPRVFRSAVEALKKIPGIKLPGLAGKFSYHGLRSGKYYLLWLLRMYLKGSDCAKYLIKGTPSEALNSVKSAATDSVQSALLEKVKSVAASSSLLLEEETSSSVGLPSLTSSEIAELQKISPEGYAEFNKQQEELDKSVKDFAKENTPKNPCSMDAAVAEAAAGGLISQAGIYQAKGGGEVYEIFDEEAAKPLMNVVKSQLAAVNQDPNIDPQHPLSSSDPYMKAYFADTVDFDQEIYMPNATGESRLGKTLDAMVEKGEIDEAEKKKVESETLEHWQNGTIPDSLKEALGTEAEAINEYIDRLKIGTVNIKRS